MATATIWKWQSSFANLTACTGRSVRLRLTYLTNSPHDRNQTKQSLREFEPQRIFLIRNPLGTSTHSKARDAETRKLPIRMRGRLQSDYGIARGQICDAPVSARVAASRPSLLPAVIPCFYIALPIEYSSHSCTPSSIPSLPVHAIRVLTSDSNPCARNSAPGVRTSRGRAPSPRSRSGKTVRHSRHS
jgi:hypothetical protein